MSEKNLGFFFNDFVNNLKIREKKINVYLEERVEAPQNLRFRTIKNSMFFDKIKKHLFDKKK